MSKKYYRVLQDTFLWEKGAILEKNEGDSGYVPVEDLWNVTENQTEYISTRLIEAPENAAFFERVYEASHLGKLVFVTKDAAQALASKFFDGKGNASK